MSLRVVPFTKIPIQCFISFSRFFYTINHLYNVIMLVQVPRVRSRDINQFKPPSSLKASRRLTVHSHNPINESAFFYFLIYFFLVYLIGDKSRFTMEETLNLPILPGNMHTLFFFIILLYVWWLTLHTNVPKPLSKRNFTSTSFSLIPSRILRSQDTFRLRAANGDKKKMKKLSRN